MMKKILIVTVFLLAIVTTAQTASVGDIVITEIMIDPNSSNEQDREWFEVYNTTSAPIDMNGWTIGDNSSSSRDHVITSATPVIVPANSYAVFVYNDDIAENAGITNAIYAYGAGTGNSNSGFPTWNNESTYSGTPPNSTTADGPELFDTMGTLIDEIEYGFGYSGLNAWPAQGAPAAASYQLNANTLDSSSNDVAANWAQAQTTAIYGNYNGSDYTGTPGAANFGFNSGVLAPGDVLITELMIDPNGSEGNTEWFEIYNNTDNPIDFQNWVIGDVSSGSNATHLITTSVIISPHSYGLFAASAVPADNGGLPAVDYAYGFNSPATQSNYLRLNNESSFNDGNISDDEQDGVFLITPSGLEIDRVAYDYGFSSNPIGFPTVPLDDGASIELGFSFFDASLNDTPQAWEYAVAPYGTVSNSFGTPGAPNDFNKVYTYDNAWLAPFNDISGNMNDTADLVVLNGTAIVATSAAMQNVDVATGADLILASGTVATVSQDITAAGDLNASDATLLLNGTSAQTISGMGTLELGIVNVDNSNGVNNTAIVDVYNEITITSGSLDNAGTFTLKNSSTGTAVINELPASTSITGDYIVERYIPVASGSQGRVFRFLASPVTTAGTIYDNWQNAGATIAGEGTHITGTVGAVGNVDMTTGFDETVSGAPSAYTYSNDTAQSWTALTSTNQSGDELQALDAYRVFIRGDRDASRITAAVAANATTLSADGTINQGDIQSNYDVEENEFVFVGNPYQAPVDMEQALANSDNVNNNVVYYWDPNLGGLNGRGAYTTVSGFATGGTSSSLPASANSEYLQPGQAVFVVASAGANGAGNDMVLRFRESDKGTTSDLSTGTVFGMNNTVMDQLTITLYDTPSLLANSTATDAVLLQVDNSFSNLNDDMDLPKIDNLDETLSIVGANTLKYGVQSIHQVTDGMSIPLNINNYGDSSYTFKIDVTTFTGFEVVLVDHFLNSQTVLNTNASTDVSFNVDTSNGSSLSSRFELIFNNVTLSNQDVLAQQIALFPNPSNGEEVILSSPLKDLQISLYNSLGQQVYQTSSTASRTTISTQGLATGIYLVNVRTSDAQTTLKLVVN